MQLGYFRPTTPFPITFMIDGAALAQSVLQVITTDVVIMIRSIETSYIARSLAEVEPNRVVNHSQIEKEVFRCKKW
jgi:hypothetical protein